MVKRLLLLAVVALAGVVMGVAPAANAHTSGNYLCYSKFETDPGLWPIAKEMPRVNDDAADVLAAGYWSPYAETSIPTGTMAGSYYLLCNLPSSMKATGQIVGQGGEAETPAPWMSTTPGFYPVAA
jgi:hypothetical protein